jgi:hypothetical protein
MKGRWLNWYRGTSAHNTICVRPPTKDVFEKIEYILFKIALLILFVAGLVRIIRTELGW